jgi:hypothetical protein
VVLNTSNCFVFGNTASGNALSVQQLGTGNVATFRTTTGATALFVNAAGNVGVGTTNPAASLDVNGSMNALNYAQSTFTNQGLVTITQTSASGTSMLTGATGSTWTAYAYSNQGFKYGAFCSARAGQTTTAHMIGLANSQVNGNMASTFQGISYAWYFNVGTLQIYESGSPVTSHGAYTTSTVVSITFDGTNIIYWKDGVSQRTVARAVGGPLYFGYAGLTAGASVNSIQFDAFGSTTYAGRNIVGTTGSFSSNVGIGTTNPSHQLTVSSNIYNESSGGGFYGMNCGNLNGLIQGVYNGGSANPDGLNNSDMFIGVNYNQQTGQRLAGTNHGVAQIQLVGANPGAGNIKFRCAAGGTGALASVPVVATITTTGLQIGGTGVTGNVLQLGNFTFQMVSYQGLFGAGTVTYTPSNHGIFVAFFASDTMVFTSSGTPSGQYSAVTTYLNSASLTGNAGLGQLSLSTAVNGVLTATFKGTGDFMRVFRMAF